MRNRIIPAGDPWWRELSLSTARADLLAGLLGALLVLPQGVAFARLAGLPPEYGIYSAILPCIVAALFGSSRHVVSGPTNANSLALFAMLAPLAVPGSLTYIQLVFTVTFLVGVLQLGVSVCRLGNLANFIAPSVLIGFTSGAACLIGYHSVLDLAALILRDGQWVLSEALVALVTIAITAAVARYRPRWPGMLIGIAGGFGAAALGEHFAAGKAAVMGTIPAILPPLSMPTLDLDTVSSVLGIALALAVVALGQSVSIAKAMAERSGQHIDVNREFFGQGLSNIVASFSSSYLSCGSLNRSLPNLESGAKTPMAAVFASLLLLLLVAAFGSVLERIPMAAIDALLLYVATSLISLPKIREIVRFSHQEAACLLVTWAATVFIRIDLAILIGVGLSLVFYLYQASRPALRVMVPGGPHRHFTPLDELTDTATECPQLKLVRMEGSVYFGATQHVSEQLRQYREQSPGQKHLIVMVKSMNFIDLAGDRVWRTEFQRRRDEGGKLYFHRPRSRVLAVWERSGFLTELLAEHRIFQSKSEALSTIVPGLDQAICRSCQARIFLECPARPASDVGPRSG
ncbi:MAG: SulP family inorganic anion transporter [Azoarcus sp.]|jgi:SulP family sulfate permease|nr:SulP family inorganic anion transporter [Azoarcus sp.]